MPRLLALFPQEWQLTARASGVLGLRVTSATLTFTSTVLITRVFGAAEAGTFFLSLAIVTVCSTLAQVGIDLPLMRMTAVAKNEGNWSAVQSLTRKGMFIGVIAGTLLTTVVWLLSPWAAQILSDSSLRQMLPTMAFGIIPYTLILLLARAFAGVGRPALSELVHRTAFQVAFIALIAVLWLTADNAAILGWAFSAAYWGVLFVGRAAWARSSQPASTLSRSSGLVLLRPGAPLLVATSLFLTINWADTLMIGYFSTSENVGIYGTALRVSATIAMILTAATTVFAPRFAALHDRNNSRELEQLLRRAATGCALVALPVCALLIAFSQPVMSIFGDEFTTGGRAMLILVAAAFVSVSLGLSGPLLVMAGRERRIMEVVALSAALNVGLNLLLIPRFSIEGAALATLAAFLVTNLLYVHFVRRDLNITLFGRGTHADENAKDV